VGKEGRNKGVEKREGLRMGKKGKEKEGRVKGG